MVDPLLVEPFWQSETMRGESLFFVDSDRGPPRPCCSPIPNGCR